MFFECEDTSLDILSVLNLTWSQRNDRSGNRPFHALSFRVRGDADMTTADGSTVHFGTGDIALVPADLVYTQVAKEERLYVIHFTCNEIPVREIKKFTAHRPEYFEQLFMEIYTVWTKKQAGYLFECKSKLYKLMYKIEREWSDQRSDSADDKLRGAIESIHDHFTDHTLTVERLAHRCGMSDTYFRRRFYEMTGTTPLKYINQLRMTYAHELLQSNYFTVEEISQKCGFNNVHYFSLFVKKQTGLSPLAYRDRILGNEKGEKK